jgi:predicted DNA-binding transcriptional regulator AlpA
MELWSITDVATLLGMTRAGAHKLVRREATFPAPVAVLTGRTRVWHREDVERWARETGRIK